MRIISGNFRALLKNNTAHLIHRYFNSKPPWNVLFFGTDNFSLASLKALNSLNDKYIGKLEVVTSAKNNIVRKYAIDEKLVLHNWPEFPRGVFDIGLIVSFGHLIPKDVINSFPMGMLNVHASLLPRWRGAAPIIYAIANGDLKTGVSIMKIHPHKFDVGEVLRQDSINIEEDVRMPELHQRLATLGADNLIETIKKLPDCLKEAVQQSKEGVTFAPKISSSMANVDFRRKTCKEIYDLGRALTGVFPLLVHFQDKPVKLHNVSCYERCEHSEVPGTIAFDRSKKIVKVFCTDGFVAVDKLGVLNKKVMNASEFNNGYLKKTDVRIFRFT
ncbi:PREDICTED: methionyl-tRNA formyltransferase, mitochondrial isoform X2 [Nicrophorus vespilloides]|uniref:Methionyl-tRNA formyltransferase, mitochondrial n=1 Tax=Nicrophorus vespilloides TaxID=110193 RepID=A0ABM1N217_NICVS|nr:PREDICTED: methionyl-tRNA formyltransferase, mitochondrial isoform X2 [Nicrophorus vespilloides]